MKINGRTIVSTDTPPTEEGYYIFTGKFSKVPEIIHVVAYPSEIKHGIQWASYFADATHRFKNVASYQGSFVKIEL